MIFLDNKIYNYKKILVNIKINRKKIRIKYKKLNEIY